MLSRVTDLYISQRLLNRKPTYLVKSDSAGPSYLTKYLPKNLTSYVNAPFSENIDFRSTMKLDILWPTY